MKDNTNNSRTGAERILDTLENAPDEMILSSEPKQAKRSRFPVWARWTAAAAACAVIAGGAAAAFMLTNRTQTGTLVADEDLPKITPEYSVDAMGFEGYQLYDISDLASSNPWREEQNITVLPVYLNTMQRDRMSGVPSMTADELLELMTQREKLVANALGIELSDDQITNDAMSEEAKQKIQKMLDGVSEDQLSEVPESMFQPHNVEAKTDEASIYTYTDLSTTVWFNSTVPTDCTMDITDLDKAQQAVEYLKSEYSELLTAVGVTEPAAKIEGGDYFFTGERSPYRISFYNAGSTPEESLLNYSLYDVNFYGDENGLNGIHVTCRDMAKELVGNYPLLTVEEAAEQLKAGNYGSSVPVGEGYAPDSYDRVELIYRTRSTEKYYMPYYRFYVNVTDDIGAMDDVDTDTFGAFYVPAVKPEYIEDVPTYNGEFNK